MRSDPPRFVLASASPRRKELLARLVATFDVISSDVEENPRDLLHRDFPPIKLPTPYDVSPDANPILWGWRKAMAVASDATSEGRDALILGADTVVVVDRDVLGKPRDAADAQAMLRRLAGRQHHVVTGWALVLARPGERATTTKYAYVSSMVEMDDYGDDVIDWYLRSGEPLDKAGAYAAQGLGAELIKQVDGCYRAVVGLPLCEIRAVLISLNYPVLLGERWRGECQGPYCGARP